MDRISALRNVEEALAAFEDGETDLAELERRVRGVLRTYATDFEGDLAAYRATADDRTVVVMATGEQQARERARSRLDADGTVTVEHVSAGGSGE